MRLVHNKGCLFTWIIIITGAMSLSLEKEPAFASSLEVLKEDLPFEILGWKAEPEDEIFNDKTIFDYINGAGEVYRAYDMRSCLSRRFKKINSPDIILDIFDMGTDENAFGVFTHDRDGEERELGGGALYRYGWLRFWKDRYFISIYPEEEDSSLRSAVLELGKKIASLIKNEGSKPGVLSFLPREGLVPRSIHYFHDPAILNYHYYLADENILFLGHDTQAVLSEYLRGERSATMLVTVYPSREKAIRAHESLLKSYLPEAGSRRIVRLENGMWSGSGLSGRTLIFVLESESLSLAEDLIKDVRDLVRRPGQ